MFLAVKFVSIYGCNILSIQTVDSDATILALYYAPLLRKPFKDWSWKK